MPVWSERAVNADFGKALMESICPLSSDPIERTLVLKHLDVEEVNDERTHALPIAVG